MRALWLCCVAIGTSCTQPTQISSASAPVTAGGDAGIGSDGSDPGDAGGSNFDPTTVHYGPMLQEGSFTTADLKARDLGAQQQWEDGHTSIALIRHQIRSSRAVVELRVESTEVVDNTEMEMLETNVHVQLLQVHAAVTGYAPSVNTIVIPGGRLGNRVAVFSHQPQLIIGKRYLVLNGLTQTGAWRGCSNLDVLEIATSETLVWNGTVLRRADFDALLSELNAEAGANQ
jgi:hypothetical protein